MECRLIKNFMVCPYDESHVISPLRMPYHLMKCRKNYPDKEMAVCPFNAIHELPKLELKYHMLQCPNKVILEREVRFDILKQLDKVKVTQKGYTGIPSQRKPKVDPNAESWDTDSYGSAHTEEVPRARPRNRELLTVRQPFSLPKISKVQIVPKQDTCDATSKMPDENVVQKGKKDEQKEIYSKGRGLLSLYTYSGRASGVPLVGLGRGLVSHVRETS
ncbi:protein D7-like [Biomphalaria glabrata]|uniref:Protein D7-like n=1 Tax=Biomphalaria glabrata TaxID=6526 RepID=A0A9W2ZBF9_BIOGL|nr:protein D7-like [Biomphalaria glabrata]